MKIEKQVLEQAIKFILKAHTISEEDALIATRVLIMGTVRGYNNHGIDRIFQILEGLEKGTIDSQAKTEIIRESTALATMNANYGLGYSAGHHAMNLAIRKAQQVGVGVVGVINSSHLGILSYYSELASLNNCIGIVLTTSSPAAVIKGGTAKTFGTNPISYSIPYNPYPITADFSTTKVSRGRLYEYLDEKKEIPLGWAVDEEGLDTIDPVKGLKGGLKTIDGDIKGGLISLLVSILSGNLIGGVSNHEVTGTRDVTDKPNKGDFFIAFNIDAFTDLNIFSQGIKNFMNFISEQNASFRIPGERSYLQQLQQGSIIEISDKIAELIKKYGYAI